MLNLTPEYHETPFPYMVFRDFITDPKVLDYVSNNQELRDEFDRRDDLTDLERLEMGLYSKAPGARKYYYDLRNPLPTFSDEYRAQISDVLLEIERSKELAEMVSNRFMPVFKEEYGMDFDETFRRPVLSYGAYNGTSKPLNLIGWHIDRGQKLCSGFVYLREDGDEADDGHLYLSSGPDCEPVEVRYEHNVLVIWPNVPYAWHMAGVRNPTEHLRRIINVVYTSKKSYHDYSTGQKDTPDPNELYSTKDFGFKEVKKL